MFKNRIFLIYVLYNGRCLKMFVYRIICFVEIRKRRIESDEEEEEESEYDEEMEGFITDEGSDLEEVYS